MDGLESHMSHIKIKNSPFQSKYCLYDHDENVKLFKFSAREANTPEKNLGGGGNPSRRQLRV